MSPSEANKLAEALRLCNEIVRRIERFDINRDKFINDGDIHDLLLMPIAQIGETITHVDDETLTKYQDLWYWRAIRGFRNTIVHDYGSVNLAWTWQTIEEDIPDLAALLREIPEVVDAYNALTSDNETPYLG